MSRVALGDCEITLVRAGLYWWDGGAFFGVVPRTLWSKKFEPDAHNRVRMGFNCYVIRNRDHSILIETGPATSSTPEPVREWVCPKLSPVCRKSWHRAGLIQRPSI